MNCNSDEISSDIPDINSAEIEAEAASLLTNNPVGMALEHCDVFDEILANLEPINFRAEANLAEKEKLTQRAIEVLTIREVLRVARELDCGLCKNGDFIYTYNSEYWKVVEEDTLKSFLGRAAERCGVDPIAAEHFQFRDRLLCQFLASGHLSRPDQTNNSGLINLQNGTFEITPNNRVLREFRREDFLRYQLPFAYDPSATCPRWQAFLDEVLPDEQKQRVLAEFFGYIFTDLKLEQALLAYGGGANGKSVTNDVITSLLGEENITHYSLASLTTNYHRAMLSNKLLNYSSEISNRLESDIFKKLTSGEPVEARLPYGQPFIMTRYAKLAFNCNELPRDVEHTEAFFRRFLIVPFDVTIPQEQRNPNLAKEIIETELSGVFNWVLNGLQRLLEQGTFSQCEAARLALETYRRESDSVALFIEEIGYQQVSCSEDATLLKVIYAEYKTFCGDGGYRALSSMNFHKRLGALGFDSQRINAGRLIYARRENLF
jgi:putative DNA primase/helicase